MISISGPVKIHVQNRRFSLTAGVPPKLVNSWNFNDLRRFGPLENGRFCFEGGSRCGKGEGIHILRLDDPQELQKAFEEASNGKLESRRKSMYKCKLLYNCLFTLQFHGIFFLKMRLFFSQAPIDVQYHPIWIALELFRQPKVFYLWLQLQ